MKPEKIFVIVQESVLASVTKDIVTFGMIGALLYFNHKVLDGNFWIDLIFILIVMMYVGTRSSSKVYSGNKEGAVKWLQGKE